MNWKCFNDFSVNYSTLLERSHLLRKRLIFGGNDIRALTTKLTRSVKHLPMLKPVNRG